MKRECLKPLYHGLDYEKYSVPGHCLTLVFVPTGHDTTASGISWILYSLAQHQDHQRYCVTGHCLTLVFVLTGHDTTASGISWILYSLAQHQDYQRKCQEEIDEILRDRETNDIEWSVFHAKFGFNSAVLEERLALLSQGSF